MQLVGVDVGGTFTDVLVVEHETGEHRVHKVPTTTHDPAEGVRAGVEAACAAAGVAHEDLGRVLHGTTIATNALLEHHGARVGVITTEGFRDILHIGRHQRPQNYSIMQEIPWQDRPLSRRRDRKVVPERIVPPTGEVLRALDEDAARAAARELRDAGCDAIAVCLLSSYLNDAHEQRVKAIVLEEHPDAFVTASAEVHPQFREFERFTTAAVNAFVGPPVRAYLRRLGGGLRAAGVRSDVHIMRSNGGVAPIAQAAEEPVTLLLSGPAAGVLGGAFAGERSGRRDLITFDVGGTSADIGTVVAGGSTEASARDTWVAGFPVMVPMIDISTIGAGGGSIAYVDEGGAFRVGPRSAGAEPGPAAYGRGGSEPTVTDAHVVLGRLLPGRFLGGEMALDADAATRVVGELGDRLGLGLEAAAEGILTLLDAAMADAIRALTVQRGLDPRAMTLVAFGGAGPLHAVEVARSLGVRDVLVPPYPGITSAIGLLTTDIRYDRLATQFARQGAIDFARLGGDLAALEAAIREQLAADGVAPDAMGVERSADCRYLGQGYELRLPLPDGELDDAALEALWSAMHERHRAEYGHAFEDSVVEIVNVRVTGTGAIPKVTALPVAGERTLEAALVATEEVVFRGGERLPTAFYERARLPLGEPVEGPAVILQADTTTLLAPGSRAELDDAGNLLITLEEG